MPSSLFSFGKVLAAGAEFFMKVAETAWWDLADTELEKEKEKRQNYLWRQLLLALLMIF
jgi:hypothetical protein